MIASRDSSKGVARPKILELSSCDFIGRDEDVILAGPIGTGKTMLGWTSRLRAAALFFSL